MPSTYWDKRSGPTPKIGQHVVPRLTGKLAQQLVPGLIGKIAQHLIPGHTGETAQHSFGTQVWLCKTGRNPLPNTIGGKIASISISLTLLKEIEPVSTNRTDTVSAI